MEMFQFDSDFHSAGGVDQVKMDIIFLWKVKEMK